MSAVITTDTVRSTWLGKFMVYKQLRYRLLHHLATDPDGKAIFEADRHLKSNPLQDGAYFGKTPQLERLTQQIAWNVADYERHLESNERPHMEAFYRLLGMLTLRYCPPIAEDTGNVGEGILLAAGEERTPTEFVVDTFIELLNDLFYSDGWDSFMLLQEVEELLLKEVVRDHNVESLARACKDKEVDSLIWDVDRYPIGDTPLTEYLTTTATLLDSQESSRSTTDNIHNRAKYRQAIDSLIQKHVSHLIKLHPYLESRAPATADDKGGLAVVLNALFNLLSEICDKYEDKLICW